MRTKQSSGFTLMETILAFAIMAVAFLVLFSVFSGGFRQAVQSRNRTVAIMYAQSLLEEIKAHPFGQKRPQVWLEKTARPVDVVVEGRKQSYEFAQEIKFQTGAFVGEGSDADYDEVTITLNWHEGVGKNPLKKELVVKTAVWR